MSQDQSSTSNPSWWQRPFSGKRKRGKEDNDDDVEMADAPAANNADNNANNANITNRINPANPANPADQANHANPRNRPIAQPCPKRRKTYTPRYAERDAMMSVALQHRPDVIHTVGNMAKRNSAQDQNPSSTEGVPDASSSPAGPGRNVTPTPKRTRTPVSGAFHPNAQLSLQRLAPNKAAVSAAMKRQSQSRGEAPRPASMYVARGLTPDGEVIEPEPDPKFAVADMPGPTFSAAARADAVKLVRQGSGWGGRLEEHGSSNSRIAYPSYLPPQPPQAALSRRDPEQSPYLTRPSSSSPSPYLSQAPATAAQASETGDLTLRSPSQRSAAGQASDGEYLEMARRVTKLPRSPSQASYRTNASWHSYTSYPSSITPAPAPKQAHEYFSHRNKSIPNLRVQGQLTPRETRPSTPNAPSTPNGETTPSAPFQDSRTSSWSTMQPSSERTNAVFTGNTSLQSTPPSSVQSGNSSHKSHEHTKDSVEDSAAVEEDVRMEDERDDWLSRSLRQMADSGKWNLHDVRPPRRT